MLLKQKKVNCHKCGVNFMISGKHISSFQEHTLSIVIPSVKRFSTAADLFDKPISLTSKNLSSDFRKTHFVEKPPFLRSSFVRRPPFVRRRANKQWPYRRATDPTHTLRCHLTSFFSSSSSCSRNWWQKASTRSDKWTLIPPVSPSRMAIWPQSSIRWVRDADI